MVKTHQPPDAICVEVLGTPYEAYAQRPSILDEQHGRVKYRVLRADNRASVCTVWRYRDGSYKTWRDSVAWPTLAAAVESTLPIHVGDHVAVPQSACTEDRLRTRVRYSVQKEGEHVCTVWRYDCDAPGWYRATTDGPPHEGLGEAVEWLLAVSP